MSEPLFFISGVTGKIDIGYRFADVNGDWIGARITAGVFETDALVGTYGVAAATIPATAKLVHWDSAGTASINGDEVFDTVGFATIGAALGTTLTGPRSITLTWKDAGAVVVPLVDFTVVGFGSGRANGSGVATFGLADGTYTIASRITSGVLFPNLTLVVNGTESEIITGTALAVPSAPADPNKASAYVYVQTTNGATAAGFVFNATLVDRHGNSGVFKCGSVLVQNTVTATSALTGIAGSVGLASLDLYTNADILPSGSRWQITCAAATFSKLVSVPSGGINIGSLIA